MMQDALNLDEDEEETDALADEEVDKVVQDIMLGEMSKIGGVGSRVAKAKEEEDADDEQVQSRLDALKS